MLSSGAGASPWRELIGSTIWVANSERGRSLIARWVRENERHPNVWDQKNLQAVLNRMPDGNPEVLELPEAYFKIFDTMASVEGAVIEQYQKSRTHRRKVNAANLIGRFSASAAE